MIIQWLQDCEVEIVEWYDEENDETHTSDEIFKKGETSDVDLVDDRGETVNFQFPDGSMVYGLPKKLYRVEKTD